MKREVLLVAPLHAATQTELEATYVVHRAWEATPHDALLAAVAPRIEILTARHGRPPIVLLASTQLELPRGSWHLVLARTLLSVPSTVP